MGNIRTWGFVTLTGSAQPVFATTLASAFTLVTDGNNVPIGGQTLAFTDATNFKKGDRIKVVEADGTLGEFCTITKIATNTVTVDNITKSHASGAWVILDEACTTFYIQTGDTNAGQVGIGTSKAVALTGGAGNTLILILEIPSGGQPPEFFSNNVFGANPIKTSDVWAKGTALDTILPSCQIT